MPCSSRCLSCTAAWLEACNLEVWSPPQVRRHAFDRLSAFRSLRRRAEPDQLSVMAPKHQPVAKLPQERDRILIRSSGKKTWYEKLVLQLVGDGRGLVLNTDLEIEALDFVSPEAMERHIVPKKGGRPSKVPDEDRVRIFKTPVKEADIVQYIKQAKKDVQPLRTEWWHRLALQDAPAPPPLGDAPEASKPGQGKGAVGRGDEGQRGFKPCFGTSVDDP